MSFNPIHYFISGREMFTKNGIKLLLEGKNASSGTTWTDASGNGFNGTLTNGAAYNSTNGGSVSFDGVNDYINNIGSVSSFSFAQNTGVFSIAFWMKLNSVTGRYHIIGNSITTVEKGFFIAFENGIGNGTKALSIQVFNGTSAKYVVQGTTTDNVITDTNWHFCCYTSTYANTIGQWYVDGVAITTTARASGLTAGSLSTGNSAKVLTITLPTTLQFSGAIELMAIWNRAISNTQQFTIYKSLKNLYGL